MTEIIEKAIEVLDNDGVLLYPSDTIWGLGGSVLSQKSQEKIYEIKKRDFSKKLLLLVSSVEMLSEYVSNDYLPIAEDFWHKSDKPLTIIFSAVNKINKALLAEDGSIGIRLIKKGIIKELIEQYNYPITSTSANLSGQPSPTAYELIDEQVLKQVDYILPKKYDIGTGMASSIIKLNIDGSCLHLR